MITSRKVDKSPIYLRKLERRLKSGEESAVPEAVKFLCGNSRGMAHNRVRAHLARMLKWVPLTLEQQQQLTSAILQKLADGDIDEQFTDQLRLAVHLDRKTTQQQAAALLVESQKDYVRRYAAKALRMGRSVAASNNSLQARRP